ncbi:MAG: hypothetical protein IBX60_09025 [Candidatus Aminicenantes bacterium]|nr:hypothetical protein [Candidatus Aminicenantes bacterium]
MIEKILGGGIVNMALHAGECDCGECTCKKDGDDHKAGYLRGYDEGLKGAPAQ